MIVSEALSLISGHGGFDPNVAQTSDTMQRAWLSTAVCEAVAEARWLKQRRNFGPTVAGQQDYVIDTDVVWIKSLRVGTSRPWGRATMEELWHYEAGNAWLTGSAPGVFAPSWESEAGTDVDDVPRLLSLAPIPTTSGDVIQAVCAVNHKPIVAATSSAYPLQIPDDLAQKIAVDGPIALGLLRVHERADLAAPYLARYESGKAELKKRANSQVGGGVRYIPVRRSR